MDKALFLALFPACLLLLLFGVVALHARKGKKLDLRLEGLGIKLSLHSEDRSIKDELVVNEDPPA